MGGSHSGGAAEDLVSLLTELGTRVRRHLVANRNPVSDSRVVGHEGGDTIFAIDRKVEPIIVSAIESWPESVKPLLVVAEGLGPEGCMRFGGSGPLKYRVLIDPIDGTRNLMYDKRSAWFLAAIAPDGGEGTSLSDVAATAMVELPTAKQLLADSFSYTLGGTVRAIRERIDTGATEEISVAPSREIDLRYGFGQVSNFFPGTKRLAADLTERIAEATLGEVAAGQATMFEDQYISTGGQLVELLIGHDRFCCDLRPIFYDILERTTGQAVVRGLVCHPYDMAGAPLVTAAGVVLTDGYGNPLDVRFGVDEPVHWCGYSNEALRKQIEPVIQAWIREWMAVGSA